MFSKLLSTRDRYVTLQGDSLQSKPSSRLVFTLDTFVALASSVAVTGLSMVLSGLPFARTSFRATVVTTLFDELFLEKKFAKNFVKAKGGDAQDHYSKRLGMKGYFRDLYNRNIISEAEIQRFVIDTEPLQPQEQSIDPDFSEAAKKIRSGYTLDLFYSIAYPLALAAGLNAFYSGEEDKRSYFNWYFLCQAGFTGSLSRNVRGINRMNRIIDGRYMVVDRDTTKIDIRSPGRVRDLTAH